MLNNLLKMKNIMFVYDLYVILFHIALHFIFCNENIDILVTINVISILTYVFTFVMLNKEKLRIVYLTTIFEIVIFALFSTIYLGNDLLFHTYNIAVMPIMAIHIYYKKCIQHQKKRIYLFTVLAYILFSILFFLEFMFLGNKPLYFISDIGKSGIFFLNSLNIISAVIFGSVLFLTLAISVQTQYEKIIHQNFYLAMHDLLTNLPNRHALDNEIKVLQENKTKFGVVLADIDDFKKINDVYGHDCGDYILKEIANILSLHIDENIKIFRFGGEEILFLYFNEENIEKYFDKLRKLVSDYTFHYNKDKIKVSLTFGIAKISSNFDKMLKMADMKLYEGKRKGKNIVIY